jgi:hypothetical protein
VWGNSPRVRIPPLPLEELLFYRMLRSLRQHKPTEEVFMKAELYPVDIVYISEDHEEYYPVLVTKDGEKSIKKETVYDVKIKGRIIHCTADVKSRRATERKYEGHFVPVNGDEKVWIRKGLLARENPVLTQIFALNDKIRKEENYITGLERQCKETKKSIREAQKRVVAMNLQRAELLKQKD